jgi:Regulator of G protein signaling domain
MSSHQDPTSDSNSPAHTVARADIRASAEKILYTFLLPGSEREITLPHAITHDITVCIEERGRDDPEVFDAAKDYVFQAMERDAFPGFLRMKALGNLVPPSMMMRLIIGLFSMFAAFWVAFVLIFLNYPRQTRVWVSLMLHGYQKLPANSHLNRSSSHSRLLFTALSPTNTLWTL